MVREMNVRIYKGADESGECIIGPEARWERLKKVAVNIEKCTDKWIPYGTDSIRVYFNGTVCYEGILVSELMFKFLPNHKFEIIPPYIYLKENYNASAE